MPSHLKGALVRPVLKKPSLDKGILNNYLCPICVSKTTECVVAARLSAHMSEYNLCGLNQSAYKPYHSLETAIICVQNYILHAMDNENIDMMLFLDWSAAFDTVGHSLMLRRMLERSKLH